MGLFNRVQHLKETLAPETAVVNETAMVLDAEAPAEFGVSVPNGEFFRKVSVSDKVLLVRGVRQIDREGRVAYPLARGVDTISVDASRTVHIRQPRSDGDTDTDKQPDCVPGFHSHVEPDPLIVFLLSASASCRQ